MQFILVMASCLKILILPKFVARQWHYLYWAKRRRNSFNGSKRLSKIAMIAADVPCVPGYEGDQQDIEYLAEQAEKLVFH